MTDLRSLQLHLKGEDADTHYNLGSAHIPPRRFAALVWLTLASVRVELAEQILDALLESRTLRGIIIVVDQATHA